MTDQKTFRLQTKFTRCLFWGILSVCALVFLIWCDKKAYGILRPNHVLPFGVLALSSLFLHLRDRKTSVSTAIGFTAATPAYDIRFDYIRLFAVFSVLMIHCIDIALPVLSMEINEETTALIQEVPPLLLKTAAVLRTCFYLGNTCFLMLTGALLFGRGTKEGIGAFYQRRFSKVVLTSVIYFFFYIWQNGRLHPVCAATVKDAFYRILTGSIQEDCPFLWLVYMTISIYIAVPFLRYMFESMTYRTLTALSGLILLCSFLRTYTTMTADLLPFFAQWIGIAMIGYWVSRPETRTYDRWIWIAALLSFLKVVLSVNPYVYWQAYVNYYVHMAPLSIFMACGIFALALHKKPERKHFWDSLVMMFGKHSFTILLLHWWVLYHIVIYTLNLDITWKQPLVFAGTVIFVILASFAYGFLIDQTVVYTIRACYEWMVKHIQRIYQK